MWTEGRMNTCQSTKPELNTCVQKENAIIMKVFRKWIKVHTYNSSPLTTAYNTTKANEYSHSMPLFFFFWNRHDASCYRHKTKD